LVFDDEQGAPVEEIPLSSLLDGTPWDTGSFEGERLIRGEASADGQSFTDERLDFQAFLVRRFMVVGEWVFQYALLVA
jgi:hypothetical protein